jgi:hypothetical protein
MGRWVLHFELHKHRGTPVPTPTHSHTLSLISGEQDPAQALLRFSLMWWDSLQGIIPKENGTNNNRFCRYQKHALNRSHGPTTFEIMRWTQLSGQAGTSCNHSISGAIIIIFSIVNRAGRPLNFFGQPQLVNNDDATGISIRSKSHKEKITISLHIYIYI